MATAPPPRLHTLSDGRFEATCGRCMAASPVVTAPDGQTAWKWLVRMGWSHYMPTKSPHGYALCARCSGTPWSIDLAAEMAKNARKPK